MRTIQRLRLDSFLSFAPGSEVFDLTGLNVLIGPNGSGKSNVIEAMELLRATPADLAKAIRDGGGPTEWLWKGENRKASATLDVELGSNTPTQRPLRYRLEFTSVQSRVEVIDEAIEEIEPLPGKRDVFFYYRFQRGRPAINVRNAKGTGAGRSRRLERETLLPDQSVLTQRKDPDLYPEVTWVGQCFGTFQTFREWTFGRYAPLRQPQPADLPDDRLLPDARNLALVLNQIEHKDGRRFNQLLKRFFPRFERMSTRVSGGTVQFYLHEPSFDSPIPPTRLSDGTIRFVALLATLLSPSPPPLVCIEEPELGLHPDAVTLIADLLLEASERMQLIVTTHSDALVSALTNQADAVIACERPGAGTILRRLDPKKLASWLDDYRLGDLWRMGELGANP
jgi:predicted ATPase